MAERDITEDEGELGGDTLPAATADELFEDFEQARVLASARQALFGRGQQLRIGRYVVERRLGAGGMGEVYLARDEELRRKVAVKRVLPGLAFAGDPEREQERLRREARALARLTHPNVVGVYEIGEHQGRRFVAMEYVEGETLAEWLTDPRPWRVVLDRFLAAGRGLAAAHAAGLVHRDFKPDNVLVNHAGEVRVADFGLVRTPGLAELAHADLEGPPRAPRGAPGPTNPRLSATGAVLGTVRYMPLEQLQASSQADARSDQFSYCVALYEALWGQPPFPIDSLLERLEALESGEPRRPPRGSHVPPGLWRAIRRGLAQDPEARWPSMNALLAELARAPRRRRAWAIGGAGLVSAALGFGWAAMAREPAPSCSQRSARELATIYGARETQAIASRYQSSELVEGPALGARVLAALDEWSRAWVETRTSTCEAHASQAETPSLRAQELCLAHTQRAAGSLIELLEEAEDGALARALEVVAELPDPRVCTEADPVLRMDPPPQQHLDEIAELRAAIARAHQLRQLGRYGETRALLAEAETRVKALDYAPLDAEFMAEQSKLELTLGSVEAAHELLRKAIDKAEVSHHEALAAELWIELSLQTIDTLDDPSLGRTELRRAEVASERLAGAPANHRARLGYAKALVLLIEGQRGAGEQALLAAIDQARDHDPRGYPTYLARLARLRASEDPDASLALRREALRAAETYFGSAHPATADFDYALGSALTRAGNSAEGRPLLERAIASWQRFDDRPNRKLGWSYQTLAELALADDELELAEAHTRALASVQAASLPPGHRELAVPELLLAAIEGKRNHRAEALAHCQAALAIWTPLLPPDDPRVITARTEAVGHLVALGRIDEALAEYEQIATHGDASARLTARLGAAELALIEDQPERAAVELEALDAAIVSGQLPSLGDDRYTHALLWAISDLRRGQLDAARVAALAEAHASVPFSDEQLDAWFDDLDLDPNERRRLGLSSPG